MEPCVTPQADVPFVQLHLRFGNKKPSSLQVSEGGGATATVAGGGSEGRRLAAYDLLPLLETLRAVLLHTGRGGSADSVTRRHTHHHPCDRGGRGDTPQTTYRHVDSEALAWISETNVRCSY